MRLFYLIGFLAMAMPALSQEEDAAGQAPGSTVGDDAAADETDSDVEEADEEEIDDSDLDVQTYEEPEDVFIPTEEIPSDEPIPFPSNI